MWVIAFGGVLGIIHSFLFLTPVHDGSSYPSLYILPIIFCNLCKAFKTSIWMVDAEANCFKLQTPPDQKLSMGVK